MISAAAALLSVLSAPQAHASYVIAKYSGVIDNIFDGSSYYENEPITYSVKFDTAKLVDVTNTVNAGIVKTGLQFNSVLAASLSDDPHASLTISIGNEIFSKFDQANYGTPDSDTNKNLGTGDFPVVEYLNGSFSGVGGVFFKTDGAALYTDPVAALLGDFDGHSFYIYDNTSDAEGDFNPASAVFTPTGVPEPRTWALTIAGLGMIGGVMRRRRASAVIAPARA